jgi:Zn-dependent peptidase ImmA (M78 family)
LFSKDLERRLELDSILGEEAPKELPVQRQIVSLDDAEDEALRLRDTWGLGDQPISSVSSLLEAKGWYVLEVPDDVGFDGMAGYVESSHHPFAVSRAGIAIDRIRINLLHEVGHAYVIGEDEKASEKAAFRFAATLLLPKDRVFEELGRKRGSVAIDELLYIKMRYGLSMQAIAYRLKDLAVISESYFVLLFRYFSSMDFRKEEPGSKVLMFQEAPLAFPGKVHRAYSEGLITEGDAERFLPGFRASSEPTGRLLSSEIKRILSLSGEERDRCIQ